MSKSLLDMIQQPPAEQPTGSTFGVEFLKPMVDMSLYEKLMKIDPSAARQFIQSRLDNLTAQIAPIKEEIKQLNQIISYDKDKEILRCYDKSVKLHSGKRKMGFKPLIMSFIDEYCKNIRFTAGQFYEKLKAHGLNYDELNVRTTLFKLRKDGFLTQPYRAVFERTKTND